MVGVAVISVLIPYRPDGGWRDTLWEWNSRQWADRAPFVEVVLGVDDSDPFNAGRAINKAAEQATGDLFVTVAADFLPDPDAIEWGAERIRDGAAWCALWSHTGCLTRNATERLLLGSPGPYRFELFAASNHAGHILPRDVWFDVGGVDERFAGWGPEDLAFRMALHTLHGPGPTAPFTCIHLWHPRREHGPERAASQRNHELYAQRYVPAIDDYTAMRTIVEEAKAFRG